MPPMTRLLFPFRSLVNRDFKIPADGWYHACPRGEFYHEDAKITQVFDETSMEAMKNRFDQEAKDPNFGGTLVDFDHFSLNSDTASEAAGWITDMEVRDEGLFVKIRWSDVGEAAVKGGRYRMVSPVFARDDMEKISDGKFRPMRLDSLAVTNSPRLKSMVPLSNREGEKIGNKMDYKNTLCSLLGLADTATDEEISAAIAAANSKKTTDAAANATTAAQGITLKAELANRKAEVDTFKNRCAALEVERDGLLSEQIDRDLDTFSDVIENREEMKKLMVSNRTMTLSLLKQLKKPAANPNAGKAPVHNREKAGQPAAVTQGDGNSAADQDKASWVGARARVLCRESQGKLSFNRAWPLAESEWKSRKMA